MILDATAGPRGIWYDKQFSEAVYMDERKEVKPDVVARWQNLPFKDNVFDLICFDPPHIVSSDKNKSQMVARYGHIDNKTFHVDFYKAFREFERVLQPGKYLLLKFNDHDKPLTKILALANPLKPLFGQRTAERFKHRSTTYWVCLMKIFQFNATEKESSV